MKLPPRQIPAFLKNPPPDMRAVLVYGPEESLIRERAAILGKTVVQDLNDAFNVSVLQGSDIAEDPARLNDEARAISMFGGRRLLRIESATDKNTVALKDYLKSPNEDAFLVIESGGLGPRSSLRKLFEASENAAALPCYADDEKSILPFLRETLAEKGLSANQDATFFLAQILAGDRGRARGEIEKLALYKGPDKTPITLDEAQQCCGDATTQNFDDLCYSLGARDAEKALRAWDEMNAENVQPIAMLRILMNHFRRLLQTKTRMADGESLDAIMNSFQPRIFFKYEDMFRAQIVRWPQDSLERVLLRFLELEARSKTSDASTPILMERSILEICGALKKSA